MAKTFNVESFVTGFAQKLLKQSGGGGFRDLDEMKLQLRKSIQIESRRRLARTQQALASTGIQTTASLFEGSAVEQQGAEAERRGLADIEERDTQMRNQATVEAQRTAIGAAGSAERAFNRANGPGFLAKAGGALIGGVVSSFLPLLAAKLLLPKVLKLPGGGNTSSIPTAGLPVPFNPDTSFTDNFEEFNF